MSDHVIVPAQSRGSTGIYHLPSDDDPETTACPYVTEDKHTRCYELDRLPDYYRLCRSCDPDRHDSGSGSGSPHIAALENADPSDIGGSA